MEGSLEGYEERGSLVREYDVHRCGFIEYMPEAIRSLVFSPPATIDYLAVLRRSSNIEIWNVLNDWHMERVIYPQDKGLGYTSIDWSSKANIKYHLDDLTGEKKQGRIGVVTNKADDSLYSNRCYGNILVPRLFSSTEDGRIVELDLMLLNEKNETDPIPHQINSIKISHHGGFMAVCCTNGIIYMYEITDEFIVYSGKINIGTNASVNRVSWNGSNSLLVGCSKDGIVVVIDVLKKRVVQRIKVDKSRDSEINDILFCNNDRHIVIADSDGFVKFISTSTFIVEQFFLSHESKVLCLTLSRDQLHVYSSGSDHKISRFTYTSIGNRQRWLETGFSRIHTHDIVSMDISRQSYIDVLVSGGNDCKIMAQCPLSFPNKTEHVLFPFPHRSIVSFSESSGRILANLEHTIQLWEVPVTKKDNVEFLFKIDSKKHRIIESSISPNGKLIAMSNVHSMDIFKENVHGEWEKMKKNSVNIRPSRIMSFSESNEFLFTVTMSNTVQMLHIKQNSFSSLREVSDVFPIKYKEDEPLSHYITSIAVDLLDKEVLAVSSLEKIVILDVSTGSVLHTIKRFTIGNIKFIKYNSGLLSIVSTSNLFFIFDVKKCQLTDWSAKFSNASIAENWNTHRSKIMDVCVDRRQKNCITLWGLDFLLFIDTDSSQIASIEVDGDTLGTYQLKSEQSESKDVPSVIFVKNLEFLIGFHYWNDSLLLVERKWKRDLASHFVTDFKKKKYGRT